MDTRDYLDFLTAQAVSALQKEVWAAPKPGLVDRLGKGSHPDMDLALFYRSACTLAPHFRRFLELSFSHPDDLVLPLLRRPGMAAEEAMRRTTGGVNTHKGAIFSLGLVLACMARLVRRTGGPLLQEDIPQLTALIRHNARGLTGELRTSGAHSHGENAYRRYGLQGIRREAEQGLPGVFQTGLPALLAYRRLYPDPDLPLLLTLLRLILVTEDTNLAARGGMAGLAFMREKAQELLFLAPELTEEELFSAFFEFDRQAVRRNLSPGGAADQLALCLFLEGVLGA